MPRRLKTKPERKHKAKPHKRYSLDQLLAESRATVLFRRTKETREWLNAPRVGRELI